MVKSARYESSLRRYPIKIFPNRDAVRPGLWTDSLNRETLYARSTSIAGILRQLGASKGDREEAVRVLGEYVAVKRSRGRTEVEIVRRLEGIRATVPQELGGVFTTTLRAQNLPIPPSHPDTRPPPLPSFTPLSLSTPPKLPHSGKKPHHQRGRSSTSSTSTTSTVETIRTPPGSGSTSSSSISLSRSSSPSTAPPSIVITCHTHHSHEYLSSDPFALDSSSTFSTFSGRPPTEFQPLAFGGWGRAWEKNLKGWDGGEGDELDRETLSSFPRPPSHLPSSSSSSSSSNSFRSSSSEMWDIEDSSSNTSHSDASDIFAFDTRWQRRGERDMDLDLQQSMWYSDTESGSGSGSEDDQRTITAASTCPTSTGSSWTVDWSEPSFGDVFDGLEWLQREVEDLTVSPQPTPAAQFKDNYLRHTVPAGELELTGPAVVDADSIGLAA